MALQVGEMSPGEVRWPYRLGEMSPGVVRWPYR